MSWELSCDWCQEPLKTVGSSVSDEAYIFQVERVIDITPDGEYFAPDDKGPSCLCSSCFKTVEMALKEIPNKDLSNRFKALANG